MNDRELLELAGKAVGIEHPGGDHRAYTDGRLWDCTSRRWWNPLTDDGDALRLAVKLRINIYNPPTGKTSASVCHGDDGYEICSYFNEQSPDPAATRRAIVRAAAEVAKSHAHHEGEKA